MKSEEGIWREGLRLQCVGMKRGVSRTTGRNHDYIASFVHCFN